MSSPRRYVVLGAGGVGCALGGLLQRAGRPVVLIARGAQLAALRASGLHLATPTWSDTLHVDVAGEPREVSFAPTDVVLVCTKSQDTEAALDALAAAAPRDASIVCAQNGVQAERWAAARFTRVYGLSVFSPITFLEPGRVALHSAPVLGGLELGAHPEGVDALATEVVGDLCAAGFDARAEPRILRWKHGKLLTNLGNALQALGGRAALVPELVGPLHEEALACYRAAGIDAASASDVYARNAAVVDLPVLGRARAGGSTWQSLARATGSLEVDALNGEIVALGERFGVATPWNRALVTLATRAGRERWTPGAMTADALLDALRGEPRG